MSIKDQKWRMRASVSMLRARQTHLLHKNGAEWGSFIQELLCLCSSVASRGTIRSQYVGPQEMKTKRGLTHKDDITLGLKKKPKKQIHISSIYPRYSYNENRISFFFYFQTNSLQSSWAWWDKCCRLSLLQIGQDGCASSCHLTPPPPPTLTSSPCPSPWKTAAQPDGRP